jgi:peptidoglycan/LPS O-acetylase OafA/YrhL
MVLGGLSLLTIEKNIFFDAPSLPFDLVANILMLQGLGIGHNLNGPSWSISTEFAAYFLFPLFFWLIFKAGPTVRILTLIVALVALCAVATRMPRLGLGSLDVGHRLVETFAQFVLGMGSYILYRRRLSIKGTATDVEVGLLVLAVGVGLIIGIDLPVSFLFPFLVVAVALNRGRFARWLSGGIPYFLGVISFSLYLIHEPFRPLGVMIFNAVHPHPATAIEALVFAFVGSMIVIPFAWATYVIVERPGRRLVRRWAEVGASSSGAVKREPKMP